MTLLRKIPSLAAVVCLFASGCATTLEKSKPIIGREFSAQIPSPGGVGKQLFLKIDAAKINDQIVDPQSIGGVELIDLNQALVARLATNSYIATASTQAESIRCSIEFAGSEDFHTGETMGKATVVGLTLGLAGPFVKHPYSYNSTIKFNCFIGDRVETFSATGTARGEYVNSKMAVGFHSVRNEAYEKAIQQIISQLH